MTSFSCLSHSFKDMLVAPCNAASTKLLTMLTLITLLNNYWQLFAPMPVTFIFWIVLRPPSVASFLLLVSTLTHWCILFILEHRFFAIDANGCACYSMYSYVHMYILCITIFVYILWCCICMCFFAFVFGRPQVATKVGLKTFAFAKSCSLIFTATTAAAAVLFFTHIHIHT